jgi:glycosyltransferase involved in cell wall biosynthesis
VKILIIGSEKLGSEYGGGQVYVNNLVAGLLANQHDIFYMSIAFTDTFLPQRLWTDCTNIKELHLIMPAIWHLESTPIGASHITNEIASVFKEFEPDVVHAHGWKEIACLAADKSGIHCIVTAHHGGIVCPAGALLNHRDEICTVPANQCTCLPCCVRDIPGNKLWLPLLRLIPYNFQLRLGQWLRTQRFMYFITPLGTLALSIRNKLTSVETLGRNAARLIAPSHAICDALVRNGIPARKIVVVPHGIPLTKKIPLRSDPGKGSAVRFLFVGRISYVKGVHVMLEAFSKIKPDKYELHIIGGAFTKPDRRYLTKLQRRYSSVNTTWHGSLPHEEIPQHIAACDLMVHPAICLEVYGLTIAEALSVGRPVIATRCGGAEMQICDGKNGLLVPPNDPRALYKALIMLTENPELVKKLADNTCTAHPLDSHIHDLEEIYKISRIEKKRFM